MNWDLPLIPYMRQSRAKEATISIEEQRRDIRRWAEAAGVTLADEVVEQGVSGNKSWRERGWARDRALPGRPGGRDHRRLAGSPLSREKASVLKCGRRSRATGLLSLTRGSTARPVTTR